MFKPQLMAVAALALLVAAPAAHAQYGGGGDVVCESHDGRFQECRTPFRAPSIGEQLSSAQCIEGRTWGLRGNGVVWVGGGCRARFVEGRGGWQGPGQGQGQGGWQGGWQGQGNQAVLRCESQDGRYQTCPAPRGARLVITRQLSDTRCVEGRNWGMSRGNVWVNDGCRAEFAVAGGGGGFEGQGGYDREVSCSSEDRRQNSCAWNPRWGRPYVIEQLSQDDCREGQSWGWDGRSRIWVDRGCRARFGAR
jgi:hypothetical protein